MRLDVAGLVALVLIAGQLGCGEGTPRAPLPLEVAYAGCSAVKEGPICSLDEASELRLWARSSPAAELTVTGAVKVLATSEIQAGTLFRLRPEASRGSLELTAHDAARSAAGSTVTWRLRWQPRSAKSEALGRAEAALAEGRFDAARHELESGWPTFQEDELGVAYRTLGRLERALGNTAAASAALYQAVDAFKRSGWQRQTVSCAAELAYGLIYDADRFAEARSLLESVEAGPDSPAEARYDLAYLRGLLANDTGDVRGSLRLLRDSAEIAERLDLTVLRMSAEQPLAHQLQWIGRGEEAAAIFLRQRSELAAQLSDCDRTLLLNNLGWHQLLNRENGVEGNVEGDVEGDSEDPTPWLEEASELASSLPCPETDERANVAINLALAALQAGRADSARQHLERAAEYEPHPDLRSRFWHLEIAARIALADAQPAAALELYRQLESLALDSLSTQTLWKAAAGRAAALEALERPDEALEAYVAADHSLDRASLAVPIDAGRESFVDMGSRVTRRHLDLLMRLGRTRQAYELARRARSRVLRSLDRQSRLSRLSTADQARWDEAMSTYRQQRRTFDAASAGDWRLPADQLRRQQHGRQLERERLQAALDGAFAILDQISPGLDQTLPPLAANEVRLIYFPGTEGWVGFAEDRSGLTAVRLGEISSTADHETLGRQLLRPFAATLERADRVRILPFSWLRDIDFHALPLEGEVPLLEIRPVLYGLDLPVPAQEKPPGTRALVVADPSGNLDSARQEGRLVVEELQRQAPAWGVQELLGEKADSPTLRQLLPTVDLFHYAGHGIFAGRGGWQSALPLAGDSLLTVADILALERAPGLVVLSGCETAKSPKAQVETATGLAHAFLSAGSRSVVAAVRPVEDRVAAELVTDYYRFWLGGMPPLEALRQAQLALRERHPDSDWASFRLLEP